MDQTNNYYHGPVTVSGADFQTQFVPSEAPYAVYGFSRNDHFEAAAQIGTMIVSRKDGKRDSVVFHSEPVWRIFSHERFYRDDAFCGTDDIDTDIEFIGIGGDTISYERFLQLMGNACYFDCDLLPTAMGDRILDAGIRIDLSGLSRTAVCSGSIEMRDDEYFLRLSGGAVMLVQLYEDPIDTYSDLEEILDDWAQFGIDRFSVRMTDGDRDYQDMVDSLKVCMGIYRKLSAAWMETKRCDYVGSLYGVLRILRRIGNKTFFMDDLLASMRTRPTAPHAVTQDDAEALAARMHQSGFLSRRDGNVMEMTDDLYRLLTWKFEVIGDKDREI